MHIKVLPEFRDLIPKLTLEEYDLLEGSIIKDGCLDPLKVWDNNGELVLLDGHNRHSICKKNNVEFVTSTVDISSKEEAINWIIDNQLGRRNLTDSQRSYLRGKRYLNEKQPEGGNRGNQHTKTALDQNDPEPKSTAKKIAEQTGVSEITIKRDAEFAKAVDEVRNSDQNLAQKVLDEEVKLPKKDVVEMAKLPTEERKEVVSELASGAKSFQDARDKVVAKKADHKAVFNATNDNIEWSKWTWNPVTGCLHGCKYCYARDIQNRFHPEQEFKPMFYENRLAAPSNTPVPDTSRADVGFKNVFVCSMADLFGEWVNQEWIDKVLEVVRASPQWNFLFLTKNPKRLVGIDWPDNAWVGTTVDVQSRVNIAEETFRQIDAKVKFLSCEPLQERLTFSDLSMFNWIIIGGRSRSTEQPEGQPKWEWVAELILKAREHDLKIYFKPNLKPDRLREYPV